MDLAAMKERQQHLQLSIVAHIDHGNSDAGRPDLEMTDTISKREMKTRSYHALNGNANHDC